MGLKVLDVFPSKVVHSGKSLMNIDFVNAFDFQILAPDGEPIITSPQT